MDGKKQKDRIRGSLIGGAIGDALGYPVEFINSYAGIQKRYGDAGITRLDIRQWWKNEEGLESVQRMFTNHAEEVEEFVSLVKKTFFYQIFQQMMYVPSKTN